MESINAAPLSSETPPVAIDFMNFPEEPSDVTAETEASRGGRGAPGPTVRPRLSGVRQKEYEDTAARSAAVLGEMHRFYRDGRLCDIVLEADDKWWV